LANQIGLIGGIGPAATDYYYRRIISRFAELGETLELTTVHADTPTLLNNLETSDRSAQVAIYTRLADRLVSAGARCVVVTSIAGHFCIEQFKAVSPLPVIDLIEAVDVAVRDRNVSKVGILGTLTVMETRFYSGLSATECVIPPEAMIRDVHDAYLAIARSAVVTDHERSVFDDACRWYFDEAGVDAILLGGTDLALVYTEENAPFPVVDCAAIHVDAVVRSSTQAVGMSA
jgi:aspartate racemase